MVQDFLTLFTHTTPIYHYDVMLAKIIHSEKKKIKKQKFLKGTLVLQMLFQGKEESTLGRRTF
jgi:hypothetical protein